MRIAKAISVSVLLTLAACGQAAAPSDAGAQTNAATTDEVTAADRDAILAALHLRANTQGQVENECGERVTPQFIITDVGAGVGRAITFVIGGGPNMASCYGDGPLVILMRATGGSWREIYQNRRGGGIIILPTQHNGANDIADGGPGFSFPVWEWNGAAYVSANREVADSALGDARFVPN